MFPLVALLVSAVISVRTTIRDDPITPSGTTTTSIPLDPITYSFIGTDPPARQLKFDSLGNAYFDDPAITTATPPRYGTNNPDAYNVSVPGFTSNDGLTVQATPDDVDMCTYLTGQALVEFGCIGSNSLPALPTSF